MVIKKTPVIQDNDKILKGPDLKFTYTKGIGGVLFEKLKKAKSEIAQIDAISGEKVTYEMLTQRCIRTAIAMKSKGITSNDIITICSTNQHHAYVPLIASYFLNVKMANTDPILSVSDTAYLLNQVRPKMIFVSVNSIELIENALQMIGLDSEIVVFGETNKYIPFSEFLVETDEELSFTPIDVNLEDTATIFFSSGSTGLPKGICLNHKALLAQTLTLGNTEDLKDIVILSTTTVYWISQTLILFHAIINKACRIIVPNMPIASLWQLIEKYKVNLMHMTPTVLAKMCQHGRPKDLDVSSLRILIFGGTCFSKNLVEQTRALFPSAIVAAGYGQTETGGLTTNFRAVENESLTKGLEKLTSSGRVVPGYALKIVDIKTGKLLGPNQQGEIRVKTEYQMNGYYKMDSSSEWDEDGFFKTGDMGYYDEDHFVYVTDMLKEILKYQMNHVSPVKLETLLMTHPAVEAALVIGIPHPIDNEHAMGLVVLKESCKNSVTESELARYVNDQVDNIYQLRGGVKIIEKLEKTPSEKYKRKYMKDLVLEGKI